MHRRIAMLLHETIADRFLDDFVKLAMSIRIGDPLDPRLRWGH